jgi:hypothetical protein
MNCMRISRIERCPRCQGITSFRDAVRLAVQTSTVTTTPVPLDPCSCALERRIMAMVMQRLGASAQSEQSVHLPDDDLLDYLQNHTDIFAYKDIANVHAEVPGHNDGDEWYWIIELKNGQFVLTTAWCDYTGWDCQSGGTSQLATSAEEAAKLAPEIDDAHRAIRQNLLAQLHGSQPFGLEIRS